MEGSHQKAEFAPLLPHGFHDRTLESLGAEFVQPFSDSTTRETLLQELAIVIAGLEAKEIRGQIWLDGSFVTEKLNPLDIDFILVMESDDYDASDDGQRQVVDALLEESEVRDTNVMWLFPPDVADNQNQIDYWTQRFGTSASGQVLKGIVRIALKGGSDVSNNFDAASSSENPTR